MYFALYLTPFMVMQLETPNTHYRPVISSVTTYGNVKMKTRVEFLQH